jgi:hypothetical protein
LYSPTASTAIDVLGEMASIPSTDVYSDFEESWADFFRKCGIPLSQLNDLARRFQLRPTILDKTGKIWLAKHTYLGDVPYFGQRRLSLAAVDPIVAKGIERLGCRRQSGLADLLEYLGEIKQEFKESEVDTIEASRILALFAAVDTALNGTLLPTGTPIFTQSSKLLRADDLFREDTSRYRSRIAGGVEFVDSRVSIGVSDAAQIPLLSRCAREELVSAESLTSVAVEKVDQLARRTRSKPFALALQRLALKYLLTRIETEVLDQLQHLRVKCCANIITRVVLQGSRSIIDTGPGPAESFYESSTNTLFLSVKSVEDAPAHLAKAVLALVDPRQRIEAAALIWLMSQDTVRCLLREAHTARGY